MNSKITSFEPRYQSTNSCFDVQEFLKTIHNTYTIFKGVNGNQIAKALVKYASAETCSNWECVVDYLNSIFIKERDVKSLITKVDWKRVCENNDDISQYASLCRTENAFEEIVKLVALSKGMDIRDILGEAFLDVYGWEKIVKDAVVWYDSALRKCEVEDIEAYQEEPVSHPKEELEKESSEEVKAKHSSKCKAVIQILNDGVTREFRSISDASRTTGISHPSICKNLKHYPGYHQVTDRASGQKCRFEYA